MTEPTMPKVETNAIEKESAMTDTRSSFRSIFKASAMIGSSAVISAGLGALRAKSLAILLGPAGIGLMGAFTIIQELSRNMAQLGLTQSGVRQIAEAASTGDEQRIAITALVLRRTTILFASLGAFILWICSGAVSKLTFGTEDQASSISLLSVALLLTVVADGRGALLQGMRRMNAVAKLSIYGALFGTLATIGIVIFARERGIVPSLISTSIAYIGLAWWFSRKIGNTDIVVKADVAAKETAQLLKLGVAFLASGLIMSGSEYIVRTFIIRMEGIEEAGLYQAAWTVGGLYVSFVLQALAMDFYPRLVGVVEEHNLCNAAVNEQTNVSMLLAAPGIIATITFSSLVIYTFYSAEFSGSIVLLQWICMGMSLRIITTPMRFIIIAMNKRLVFFAVEATWAALNVVTTWWGINTFGLEGVAIAFLLTNLLHALVIYKLASSLTGFRWSSENLRTGSCFILACLVTLVVQRSLPQWVALSLGTFITLASLWYSVRRTLVLTGNSNGFRGLRGMMRLGKRQNSD